MSISAPAPDASGHIAKPADIESLARVTAEAYGRTFVADYDGWYAGLPDTGAAVSTLDRLAGSGPVLELGVGTGRLAMPLARLGHQVTGIDVSAEMLDRLRSKDLAGTVATRQADIADFRIEQRYSLIYAAFNTLLCLTSADRQRSCLQRCADQLAPDGRLVLEYMVIPPSMPAGLAVRTLDESVDSPQIQISRHFPQRQLLLVDLVAIGGDGQLRTYPNAARYVRLEELADFAASAGLKLESRWQDWLGTPAEPGARQHIDVYLPAGHAPPVPFEP